VTRQPPRRRKPNVHFTLDVADVKRIDRYQHARQLPTRAAAIRELLEKSIKADQAGAK
jgi:hypothetical protein